MAYHAVIPKYPDESLPFDQQSEFSKHYTGHIFPY